MKYRIGQVVFCRLENTFAKIDGIRTTAGGYKRYSLSGSNQWYGERHLRGLTARELGL